MANRLWCKNEQWAMTNYDTIHVHWAAFPQLEIDCTNIIRSVAAYWLHPLDDESNGHSYNYIFHFHE